MAQIEPTGGTPRPEAREDRSPLAPADSPPGYRPPQMFAVGTAVELLRRDGTGHLKDGTGGWWVWGS